MTETKDKSFSLTDLTFLMSRLREPEYGCPWDLAQSYKTIASSTIEEVYEVIDAIEQEDPHQLKEELGDLLFQIIFYSQLGKEDGVFDFNDIVSAITTKLLRRHPHVFPEGTLESKIDLRTINDDRQQEKIKASWERIKQEERQQKGHQAIMDDVPRALPATMRALKLQKRASSVGFDWENISGVYDKLFEEVDELKEATLLFQAGKIKEPAAIEEELGDLLFTVVNLARHLKVEPEMALRGANNKFEQRFRHIEAKAKEQGKAINQQSSETLEEWWERAKQV